jgi:hypothetical protein
LNGRRHTIHLLDGVRGSRRAYGLSVCRGGAEITLGFVTHAHSTHTWLVRRLECRRGNCLARRRTTNITVSPRRRRLTSRRRQCLD